MIKNFIQILEKKLEQSNASFEEFYDCLWLFLCVKNKKELRTLSNELGVKGKYLSDTNIGNIRLEILDKSGISFML
jgi:hypothetical protein